MLLSRRYAVAVLVVAVGVVAAVATDRIVAASRSGGTCVPSGACSASPLHTTSAQAAAVLASLPVPRGFRHATCEGPVYGYTVCFHRQRSVVLYPAEMGAWVASFGITREELPTHCSPPRRFATPQLILTACNAFGQAGANSLVVEATSLVRADSTSEVGTARSLPRVPYHGSQIAVADQGS